MPAKQLTSLFAFTIINCLTLQAQVPVRVTPIKVLPKTRVITEKRSADTIISSVRTVPKIKPIRTVEFRNDNFNFIPENALYRQLMRMKKTNLIAGDYVPIDPDIDQYFFSGSDMITYNDLQKWEKTFLWRHISSDMQKARYEISELPFPSGIQKDFNGIVLSGIVEKPTNGADSIAFKLTYQNTALAETPNYATRGDKTKTTRLNNKPIAQPVSINNTIFTDANFRLSLNNKRFTSSPQNITEGNTTLYVSNLSILNTVNNLGKYYVRIIPLDVNNNPIESAITNSVIVKYEAPVKITPPPQSEESKLLNDYTITSFKYIQPHFPESSFDQCTVITGYNEDLVNSNDAYKTIKAAFPVGTVMCPQPEKDKSFFDKTFNGISGAASAVVNGVAKVYNDTKNFAKNNLQNAVCGSDETCQKAVGVGFDLAMAYAGLPPSLPNFDEMAQLAEGQLVDGAVAIAEEQSGVPCPDVVKQKMKDELHKNIIASSQKNMVDNGFMHFKPDPRGQYREAYIEIEIARTNNIYQGKPKLFKLGFNSFTEKIFNDYSSVLKQNYTASLSGSLFESGILILPYMHNIGDKTKLIMVLKPKRLFTHRNKYDGKYIRIDESSWEYDSQWHDVEYPIDMGQLSPGFQLMFLKSNTRFSVGDLKAAPGVQMNWSNY